MWALLKSRQSGALIPRTKCLKLYFLPECSLAGSLGEGQASWHVLHVRAPGWGPALAFLSLQVLKHSRDVLCRLPEIPPRYLQATPPFTKVPA